MTRIVGDVLVGVSAVEAVLCVVAYHVLSGGAWRDSAVGRHLMNFMLIIAAVLGMSVLRGVVVDVLGGDDPPWFQALRLAIFTGVPIVLGRRLHLIIRSHRRGRAES